MSCLHFSPEPELKVADNVQRIPRVAQDAWKSVEKKKKDRD